MELKYLQTFQRIVQEGGFTKAALSLNYTQSAITFQISQLEQELGARLFEKIGRHMVLSKAGEQLLPYVNEVLGSLEKMQNFQADLAECRGDLQIGLAETLLCYKMPSVLREFHQRAPQARLFLRSMNCYKIRDELLQGSLDLGLFYDNVGGFGSGLTTEPLGSYSLALVAAPEIKQAYPDFVTPDQKLPLPFIIDEPDCIFRQIFEDYLQRKVIRLDHTIELWSIPTIKNLVIGGLGISFLPRFTVEDELADGRLCEIELDSRVLSTQTINAVCARHKNKWVSPLMQLFMDLCNEHVVGFNKSENRR